MIEAFLPSAGDYFILVYSAAGEFDATRQYRLDVILRQGTLLEPAIKAGPIRALAPSVVPDPTVRTLFIYHSSRLLARYSSDPDTGTLISTLSATSSSLMVASQGIGFDLNAVLESTDASHLNDLYSAWDANPAQPLYANEVAQQIWYILDRALTSYYTATTDLVLIGGDDIIPFYRLPDETTIANESDYYAQLSALAGLDPNSPLGGSLFYHFVQTDDFYADRKPTPWRGRALYLPDLGIGRLVETPTEIMHYLNAHGPYYHGRTYEVLADRQTGHAGAALVTGYDFLKDQAAAIAGQLAGYGLKPGAPLGVTYTLTILNNDTWNVDQFTNTWFSGQLPQLTDTYNGPQTRYHLMSINGHFTHYDAIPAAPAGGTFLAQRLLTPTVDAGFEYMAFFRDIVPELESDSLIWSVGCHAGLSASDAAFGAGAPARFGATSPRSATTLGAGDPAQFRADFPQAVIKQGGNWIGNTGFGYGDSDLIGYSERLSLLFTQAIGRDIRDQFGNYIGAPIGESLARAKQLYVKTAGPSGFSVFDEKVIAQFTLYGLPFIRVRVPNPQPPAFDGAFDPQPQPVPNGVVPPSGIFTRIITFTNTFSLPTFDGEGVPRVTSVVEDSFVPNKTTILTSEDQMAPGRAVLPALSYDITLLPTGPNAPIPEPRGARLRSATQLPDLASFNPHVTTPITEQVYPQQKDDPSLLASVAWQPDQPYSVQRTEQVGPGGAPIVNDRLIVIPAQFRALDGETGQLRRFSRMVFEIVYIDPQTAQPTTLADQTPPLINNVNITLLNQSAQASIAARSVRITARALDPGGSDTPKLEVSATYTNDGVNWQRRQLVFNATTGLFEAVVNAPPASGNIFVIVEARDGAGNVAVYTAKGRLSALTLVYLPAIRR